QLARITPKLDVSKERIGRRLDLASQMAERQGNATGIVSSELGLAKVFHRIDVQEDNPTDFSTARNMQDVGRKLLQSVGFKEPDDVSIQAAIALNDRFIDDLQAIHQWDPRAKNWVPICTSIWDPDPRLGPAVLAIAQCKPLSLRPADRGSGGV